MENCHAVQADSEADIVVKANARALYNTLKQQSHEGLVAYKENSKNVYEAYSRTGNEALDDGILFCR